MVAQEAGASVFRVPMEVTGSERARWLAELAEALAEAQILLWRMGEADLRMIDALDLSARLDDARALVHSLQVSRAHDRRSDSFPERINHLWDQSIGEFGA